MKTTLSTEKNSSISRWLLPVAVLGAAVTAGLVLGSLSSDAGVSPASDGMPRLARPAAPAGDVIPAAARAGADAAPAADSGPAVERVKLETDGAPAIGPEDAPVTIVEYVDYQCSFCRRAHATVEGIKAKYGDKVRLVFLQNPLSFHADAPLAAKAALAAGEQGKFAEMHALLLSSNSVKRNDLLAAAGKLGLDMAAFQAALDSPRFNALIQRDQAQAERISATATPYFFVNGRPVRGAQPPATFEHIIEQELSGQMPPTRWIAQAEQPRPQAAPEDPNKVWDVDIKGSIARGPASAPITLVEFTAFQCGFCARSQATINQILQTYPGKVHHVVKYSPLRDDKAEVASLAAGRQGKYWEYREKLFSNQRAINDQNLRVWAREVGLDLARFEKDLADPALAADVKQDALQALQLGVNGTPTFFINGKKLVGAHPFASFKRIIDQELAGGNRRAAS